MLSLQFLLLTSVLVLFQETRGSEGGELEKLVDDYVDTFRRFLNGSTVDERLRSLAEDPEKFASLAENVGSALVNGSLGYYDGTELPNYLNSRTESADDHFHSCSGDGPCFTQTLDSFDILTTGSTGQILKQVAAPFKLLFNYYEKGSGIRSVMKRASIEKQTKDVEARDIVDRCRWQYDPSSRRVCDHTVECALRIIDRVMGPTCEETDNATLMDFYSCRVYNCDPWNLTSTASNRCFHYVLMRYGNYSTKIYDSFVGTLGRFLLMELDIFGFCRHIAETQEPVANFTERRQEVGKLVQGIAKQLLRGKKVLEESGAAKPKTWTELARPVVHAGIDVVAKGSDFPYPSPGGAMDKYQKVGEAITESILANRFNAETYRYEIVVYKPGSDPEEVCLMNSNDDVARGDYKNVNYLVSRVEARRTSALLSRIQKENATIRALFGQSTKKDLCERVREVEVELKYEFTGPGGFRTMLVTKCARKFVWYELAYLHFRAAWSTSFGYQISDRIEIFATSGNYDTQCVFVSLIP